jgi:hypothetical protein
VGWFAGRTLKIATSGIANRLDYGVTFIVHTKFTKVVAGRIIKPDGLRVGNPCARLWRIKARNLSE